MYANYRASGYSGIEEKINEWLGLLLLLRFLSDGRSIFLFWSFRTMAVETETRTSGKETRIGKTTWVITVPSVEIERPPQNST